MPSPSLSQQMTKPKNLDTHPKLKMCIFKSLTQPPPPQTKQYKTTLVRLEPRIKKKTF